MSDAASTPPTRQESETAMSDDLCPMGRTDYDECFAPFRYCPVKGCGRAEGDTQLPVDENAWVNEPLTGIDVRCIETWQTEADGRWVQCIGPAGHGSIPAARHSIIPAHFTIAVPGDDSTETQQ